MQVKGFFVPVLVLLTACQSERPQPGAIAQEWAMNTIQMGIKPLYPLTEMSPGDVFLSVGYNVDSMADIPTKAFDIQPIIYANLDLSQIPTHEQEPGRFIYPIDNSDSKKPAFKALTNSRGRANCSVSFPGFSFASTLDYNLGADIPTSVWAAMFSTAHQSKYSVSYSVPSSQCVRVQVSRLMPLASQYLYGLDAAQMANMKNASMTLAIPAGLKKKYNARPIVVIPYIVYSADALDVTINALDGSSTQLSATALALVQLSDQKQLLETKIRQLGGQPAAPGEAGNGAAEAQGAAPSPPGQGSQEAPAGAGDAAKPKTAAGQQDAPQGEGAAPQADRLASLQAQLAAVEQQLKATVQASTPSLPGVTGSVTRLSTTGITLHQVFNPPLAMGYRALQFELPGYAHSQAVPTDDLTPLLEQKKALSSVRTLDTTPAQPQSKPVQQTSPPKLIYYSPLQ